MSIFEFMFDTHLQMISNFVALNFDNYITVMGTYLNHYHYNHHNYLPINQLPIISIMFSYLKMNHIHLHQHLDIELFQKYNSLVFHMVWQTDILL